MENIVSEPLTHYVQKYGVDIANIDKFVCGRKYSAVLLKNGNIGVCANLDNQVEIEIEELKTPDLKKIFGAIFKPGDQNVLDTIRNGFGTRKYLQYARKVSLSLSP